MAAPRDFHRGECFPEIRFWGSPIRFATKITTHLLWGVTGSFTCVVIFVEKSYFLEILAAMKLVVVVTQARGNATPCWLLIPPWPHPHGEVQWVLSNDRHVTSYGIPLPRNGWPISGSLDKHPELAFVFWCEQHSTSVCSVSVVKLFLRGVSRSILDPGEQKW